MQQKRQTDWHPTFTGDLEIIAKYKVEEMAVKLKAIKKYDLLGGELLEKMVVARDSQRPKASTLLDTFNQLAKKSKYQL